MCQEKCARLLSTRKWLLLELRRFTHIKSFLTVLRNWTGSRNPPTWPWTSQQGWKNIQWMTSETFASEKVSKTPKFASDKMRHDFYWTSQVNKRKWLYKPTAKAMAKGLDYGGMGSTMGMGSNASLGFAIRSRFTMFVYPNLVKVKWHNKKKKKKTKTKEKSRVYNQRLRRR